MEGNGARHRTRARRKATSLLLAFLIQGLPHPLCAQALAAKPSTQGTSTTVAVGPQFDSTHVYLAPEAVEAFVKSFLATFGGNSTKQMVTTVTPTPSSTTFQAILTPVGLVSVFGYKTPIPAYFGTERTGYLVTDMDAAIRAARAAGADVLVVPFADPIGKDAIIQWPGGLNMQLYWHTTLPRYAPLLHIPENRVYVSADRAEAFMRGFLAFSGGRTVSDELHVSALDVGKPEETFRRIRIESGFGKMAVLVTNGILPFPYGRETTGYQVDDLAGTLAKAASSGAIILVRPYDLGDRQAAVVQFPGGYVAEIHAVN
jgi:hypothetical protein